MDHAADGLLALSTTAVALADNGEDVNDDRSSSLTDLEDAPEILDFDEEEEEDDEDEEEEEADEEDEESAAAAAQLEADSEAETERLEESPDKLKKKPFGISPSKLAHSITIDQRPEIEALTDSGASSPISPLEDSDVERSDNETKIEKPKLLDQPITNKRKRLSDVLDVEDQDRIRRRRTGSPESDEDKLEADSDNEEGPSRGSRELTVEPLTDGIEPSRSDREEEDEQVRVPEQDIPGSSDEGKSKKNSIPSRSSRRRKGVEPEVNEGAEDNEAEESDEEVDADDADAQAKSEEEQLKRAAAMEALMTLEQRFAVLRDRLYDERISQINHELAQLSEERVTHPELQRQVECVRRHRDQKFEIEQRLLVYKTAALKRKSIAERAQIHSAYFQSVRDLREKHLERISEQFYRIQRDRFKSNVQTPAYTIPFPEKRSTQILRQTAYNKEVSILSGIAKYRGFPAAPDLPVSRQKEIEEDMEKMGTTLKPVRTTLSQTFANNYDSSISAKAAGEQFLEQTPWANPQHPVNRIGMNRQLSDTFLTPAHQQKSAEATQPAGSASTIPEHPSQPASSALNTPHEVPNSVSKVESHINGTGHVSPSEARRALASVFGGHARPTSQPREMPSNQPSSPLAGRADLGNVPKRTSSVQPEKASRNDTASPFRPLKDGIATPSNGLTEQLGVR